MKLEILDGASPERARYEQELLEQGIHLPFPSKYATAQLDEYSPALFFAFLDARGKCLAGFAAQSRRAPLIAGHRLLRIEEFGSTFSLELADAIVSELMKWVRRNPRVLRLSLDLLLFDAAKRAALAELLARHNCRRMQHPNGYAETLVLTLDKSEEELFAGLHHSARRKIRQVEKHPVELRLITDPAYENRMNEMLQQTFARTGGQVHERNWRQRMELSQQHPDLSRIVGLFRTDLTGPDSLLAYAWGCRSGEHVYYSEAASVRQTGEQKLALAYGVMWDLIVWARRTGARFFDFGGITRGTHTDEDPLGGISDFKRYFSQQLIPVREEWVMNRHTKRAALVAAVHQRLRGG